MKIDPDNKEIFNRFIDTKSWEREKSALDIFFKKPVWWFISKVNNVPYVLHRGEIVCESSNPSIAKPSICHKNILESINRSKKRYVARKFVCNGGLNGICIPLTNGVKNYGFIGICHVKSEITPEMLSLFSAIINTAVEKIQKDLELARLYDTIKPRAVALSTIHTIHRLISSTLNIDELLPRIARLSLQVLRASHCNIFLCGNGKFVLKANVDLKPKGKRWSKLNLNTRIAKKVAREGNPLLEKLSLAVPLIEEDVIGVIVVSKKEGEQPFSIFDKEILSTLAEQSVVAIKNAQLYKEQEKITRGSINALIALLDTCSPTAYSRSDLFTESTLAIAMEMHVPKDETKNLYYASKLHDAGIVSIPKEILKKSSKLTDKEYNLIKKHPANGVRIIKSIETLHPVIPIILYHHERYDGKGYPQGLKKDEIPIGARIMAVADAFDAMMSKRPYRKTMLLEESIEEVKRQSGRQFDPEVVDAFLRTLKAGKIRYLKG